jgi:hemerythrin
MLQNLQEMSDTAIDIFHTSFFYSDNENQSTNENNRLELSSIQNLQTRLIKQLEDWFAFVETKSQGNITISLFV